MIGQTLGHYRIVAQLGAGGMGVVYRARDERLDRDVALKVLPAGALADEAARRRFRKEALALARLSNPHIGVVHDFDTQDGVDFLVMEYIAGSNLAERLAPRGLSQKEVAQLGAQIAAALEEAHEHGIIHRDLKPANILVTPKGQAKVLDFGLAKLLRPVSNATTESFTETQATAGTLPYMAPEQLRGEVADARTDLFAAGAVLYEMSTGRRPFNEPLATRLADAILHQPPVAPRAINPRISPELEQIILKCLEKDPENRYQSAKELVVDLRRLAMPSFAMAAALPARAPSAWRRAARPVGYGAAGLLVLVALLVGLNGGGLFHSRRAHALTEKDTVVLADFTNTTGDAVFDDTLRQGLAVQLEQSPFLSLISEERIQQTLRLMGQPADERLTPEIAREICQRTGSAAVLSGSIASLGSQYVLGLKAVNCRTGDSLAQEQATADGKERVLKAVGEAATKLRSKLGESLSTVEKLDTPLEQATTPSLEALKAFTLGSKQRERGLGAEAIPFFKRAIELDPNFALAYANLGAVYGQVGESELRIRYMKRAFELRDRASEKEKFYLSGHYYIDITGELAKAMETYQLWRHTYPRDWIPQTSVAVLYEGIGQFDQAVEPAQEGIRLNPKHSLPYLILATAYLDLNRLEEAKDVCKKGLTQNPDSLLHLWLYQIAFAQGDTAAMQNEAEWARGKPAETGMLWSEAAAAATSGKLRNTRELLRRAAESAQRQGFKERVTSMVAWGALTEAESGNYRQAREQAMVALAMPGGLDAKGQAALALALSGDAARAEGLANELEKRFPLNTLVNSVIVPAVRAATEINRNNPTRAVDLLRAAAPYDRGEDVDLTPIYIRGQAYLRLRTGKEAAAEFQKILDHSGLTPISLHHPLAHLGVARAWAVAGDPVQSRAAYQDFLTLWKDADPDIPILQQAKAEYAKLK